MSTVTCTNCEDSVVGVKEGSITHQPITDSVVEWKGIPVAGFGYGWVYPTRYSTLTEETNNPTPSPVPISTDTFAFLVVPLLILLIFKWSLKWT